MNNEILTMVTAALAGAPVVAGIVQLLKKYMNLEGVLVIVTALLTGMLLYAAVAALRGYPLAESIFMGFLTGLASVGAFEGFKQVTR